MIHDYALHLTLRSGGPRPHRGLLQERLALGPAQ